MKKTWRQTALITGASSGIGLELSRIFASRNYDLVLVARGRERLERLADQLAADFDVQTRVFSGDLSERETVGNLEGELTSEGVVIDILVNNAGFGIYGAFSDIDFENEHRMMQLNMVSLTDLTKRILAGMLDRGQGKILNVASTAAFQPGPLMAVYYATKAYVLSFSEALAVELKGTGVTVTCLCPGPTDTEFAGTARMEGSRLFSLLKVMDPEDVARAGFEGLMKGEQVVIPGLGNRLLAESVRVTPRSVVPRLVRLMQDRGDRE